MSVKKATVRDVARLANVSPSTVSRVLNNREKGKTIPEELRARIQECAEKVNYTPNANFRRMINHRAEIIGLVVPSYFNMHGHIFEDGHLTRMISGIEAGIEGRRYRLLLIFNDEKFIAEQEYLSLIRSQSIDGLLVWGAQPGEDYWREPVAEGLPIVFAVTVPGPPERCNYVINANRQTVHEALDYLVNKGHRKILYLTETADSFLLRELNAAVEAYRVQHPEIVVNVMLQPAFRFDLVSRSEFPDDDPPTAILAYNYEVAKGVRHSLFGKGIKIPADAEMLACYSYQKASNRLSTMVVDDFRIGQCAAEGLQKLIENPREKIQMEIPSKLFLGETTR